MFRVIFGLVLALSVGSLGAGYATAKDAQTIRIEPRPFYGATISLESGVRVFRPLPATTHVIINPNKTPLKISIKEVNKRVTHNYRYDPDGRIVSRHGGAYAIGGYIPFRKHGRRDRRRHKGIAAWGSGRKGHRRGRGGRGRRR